MRYRIVLDKPALKFLQKQSRDQQERLLRAMYALPDSGDIKPMSSHSGLYRLRVGSYRVLFSIEDEKLVVHVLAVGNRGDIYKDL